MKKPRINDLGILIANLTSDGVGWGMKTIMRVDSGWEQDIRRHVAGFSLRQTPKAGLTPG